MPTDMCAPSPRCKAPAPSATGTRTWTRASGSKPSAAVIADELETRTRRAVDLESVAAAIGCEIELEAVGGQVGILVAERRIERVDEQGGPERRGSIRARCHPDVEVAGARRAAVGNEVERQTVAGDEGARVVVRRDVHFGDVDRGRERHRRARAGRRVDVPVGRSIGAEEDDEAVVGERGQVVPSRRIELGRIDRRAEGTR